MITAIAFCALACHAASDVVPATTLSDSRHWTNGSVLWDAVLTESPRRVSPVAILPARRGFLGATYEPPELMRWFVIWRPDLGTERLCDASWIRKAVRGGGQVQLAATPNARTIFCIVGAEAYRYDAENHRLALSARLSEVRGLEGIDLSASTFGAQAASSSDGRKIAFTVPSNRLLDAGSGDFAPAVALADSSFGSAYVACEGLPVAFLPSGRLLCMRIKSSRQPWRFDAFELDSAGRIVARGGTWDMVGSDGERAFLLRRLGGGRWRVEERTSLDAKPERVYVRQFGRLEGITPLLVGRSGG